jgi:hypothetical protein
VDLAVVNHDDNDVSVLLGNGNGTFQAAVNYGAGLFPNSVVVGEFNGDGKPDLAVANYHSNNVSVLLAAAPPMTNTSTVLLSSPNPSQYGQAVKLIADVSPSNASGVIEFLDGPTVLGEAFLNLSGSAQMTTSVLASGTRSRVPATRAVSGALGAVGDTAVVGKW